MQAQELEPGMVVGSFKDIDAPGYIKQVKDKSSNSEGNLIIHYENGMDQVVPPETEVFVLVINDEPVKAGDRDFGAEELAAALKEATKQGS